MPLNRVQEIGPTMPETITITHQITADTIATTVEMPDGNKITKSWLLRQDRSFVCDSNKTWDEEPSLPEAVADEADRVPSQICSLLELD